MQNTEYVSSAVVYGGRHYGMIYLCRDCKAWVGCHKGTENPLGRLADAELRDWKKKAHAAFDPLWQEKINDGMERKKARNLAYGWLATMLSIPREACHIGMFDVEMCKRVVELSNHEELKND